jgi:hypothetical protein
MVRRGAGSNSRGGVFVATETELKIVGNEENTEVFRAFVE